MNLPAILGMHQLKRPVNPAFLTAAEHRAASLQLRLADKITAFAGSMTFVWVHVVGFAVWMLFVEPNPWPTLTLVVSLEAIFLSCFVMIGQNRQAVFAQAKADRDYVEQEKLLAENTELTRAVHELVKAIHGSVTGAPTTVIDGITIPQHATELVRTHLANVESTRSVANTPARGTRHDLSVPGDVVHEQGPL